MKIFKFIIIIFCLLIFCYSDKIGNFINQKNLTVISYENNILKGEDSLKCYKIEAKNLNVIPAEKILIFYTNKISKAHIIFTKSLFTPLFKDYYQLASDKLKNISDKIIKPQ